MTNIYAHATQVTRQMLDGVKSPTRNMTNGKPYRSARLKAEARAKATRRDDGAYRSPVAVLFHPVAK